MKKSCSIICQYIGKKTILLQIFVFSFSIFNFAQSNYQFTALSGTFTPLAGATSVATIQADDAISTPINLGFNFVLNGVNYSQIVVTSNGYLSFNTAAKVSIIDESSFPFLAPLLDDLSGDVGSASYLLSGISPNRIFTFQWLNWKWNSTATSPAISFQVKLYETSNRIEFIYRQEAGSITGAAAYIGIAFQNFGNNYFLSLNNSGTAPTMSDTNSIVIVNKPANGQIYRFNYVVKPEPTNHVTNFTVTNSPGGILWTKWTDATGATLPDGYLVLASKTNSFIDPVDGTDVLDNSDLSDGTGLIKIERGIGGYTGWIGALGLTTYYFKVYPFTNNGVSINYKTSATVPSAQLTTPFYQFTEQTGISSTQVSNSTSVWGDYNNDGFLDILVSGKVSENNVVSKIYMNYGNNSFAEQTGISLAGVSDGALAWGDYDKDSDLDILIAGLTYFPIYGPIVKIYKNNGDNTFSEHTASHLTAVSNGSSAWADLDNDGDLDIILTGTELNSEKHTRIYLNVNNEFIELANKVKGGQKIAIGDYNKDNYPDILISGEDNNGLRFTSIYKNNADNTFTEQTNISLTGVSNGSLNWGDYDIDGDLDILLMGSTYSGAISKIYKNNSDNTFTEQTTISLDGASYRNCAWGDYDNDGDLDILQTGLYGSKIYKNNGNNTFTDQTAVSINGGSFAWGDYDNDGDLDLHLTGFYSVDSYYASRIYKNNSTIANSKPTAPLNLQNDINGNSVRLSWNAASDLETPGLSLSYNVRVGKSPGTSDVVSPMADKNTGFKRIPNMGNSFLNKGYVLNNLDTGTYYWSVQTVDNGLLASNFSIEQSFKILPNFTKQAPIEIFPYGLEANAWGDYDNDGDLDLLGLKTYYGDLSQSIKIYKNNGNRSFSEQTSISLGIEKGALAWGDYDNDGDLDILTAGSLGSPDFNLVSKIYKNNGNNTFSVQTGISLTGFSNGSLAWGDYDNDGDLDILASGNLGPPNYPGVSKIYKNNGNNTFSEQTGISLIGLASGSSAWGDYDNDGDLDILTTGSLGAQNLVSKIYKNNGDNTFTDQTNISLAGVYLSSIAWGDFDNDGDLDILITGFEKDNVSSASVYRNDGNSVFTRIEADIRGVSGGSGAWGDYNNDGYLDISISGYNVNSKAIIKIYQNNKNGSFSEVFNEVEQFSIHSGWADYDNDDDLDLIGDRQIYDNNTNFPNQAPTAPTNLQTSLIGFDVKLSWNKATDPDFVNESLYYNIRIGTSPGAMNVMAPMAKLSNGYRSLTSIGNAQCNNFWIMKNLTKGVKYYWSVQAIDLSFKGGAWSPEQNFTIPNISADFSAETVCLGQSTKFVDNSKYQVGQPINSWQWDFGDGGGTSTQQNPQYTYGGTGTYNVSLTIHSALYIHTVTKTIIVKPSPKALFTAPSVCQGNSIIFNNTSVTTGVNISSWNWGFGDGTPNFAGQIPSPHNYLAGSYQVKLKALADNGCSDSIQQEVIIGKVPSSLISTTGNATFCTGGKFTLTAESFPNFKYEWRKDNIPLLDQTTNVFEAKISGVYKVNITNLLGNCTVSSSDIQVTANLSPTAPVMKTPAKTEICEGETVDISVNQEQGVNYQWYLNGGALVQANSSTYKASQKGKYTVAAIASNTCYAFSKDTISLKVLNLPISSNIQLSTLPTICPGQSIELSVENNAALTYQWLKDGVAVNGAVNALFTANKSGNYSVKIANNQCSITSPQQPITEKAGPPVPEMYLKGNKVWYIGCSVKSGVTYTWYKNGLEIPNSNKQIIVPKPAEGTYYVQLINNGECPSRSVDVKIPDDFKTGKFKSLEFLESDEDNKSRIAIYPNPSQGKFSLMFDNEYTGKIFINIKDISGKTLRQYYADKTESYYMEEMDLSRFKSGVYIIGIHYGDQYLETKIVIQK